MTSLSQEASTSSPAKSSILLLKSCFSHAPLLLKVTKIYREVSRTDHTVTICRSYTTSKLSFDSGFFASLGVAFLKWQERRQHSLKNLQKKFSWALSYPYPVPLHRDRMQILVITRRKIHNTWGKGSFRGLKPVKSHLGSGRSQNSMNRLNRTCSAEAWKAAFSSSPPKT